MDPILQVLLSWQFMLFGLAVAMVVYVLRLIVEYIASSLKFDLSKSKFWNDLLLPIIPIALGVVGAWLFTTFPYPGFTPNAAGVVARGDRLIFGLVSGGFSTVMYRVVKALLYQKLVDTAQALNIPGTNTNVTINTAPTTVVPTPVAPVVQPPLPTNPVAGQPLAMQLESIDKVHLPTRGQL